MGVLDKLVAKGSLSGFKIICMDELRQQNPERFTETGAMDHKWFEESIRPNHFIYVRKDKHSLAFTMQDGPIKEVGQNGCQVDQLIEAAKVILEGFQEDFPCEENRQAIGMLNGARTYLEMRKRNREQRGVEGTNQD